VAITGLYQDNFDLIQIKVKLVNIFFKFCRILIAIKFDLNQIKLKPSSA